MIVEFTLIDTIKAEGPSTGASPFVLQQTMYVLNIFLAFCLCACAFVANVDAFHHYFDEYDDDWQIRRPIRRRPRPIVVSASVEESPEKEEFIPKSYESGERYYSRPSYRRLSYYEPKPFYGGGGSYGYRSRYGKK